MILSQAIRTLVWLTDTFESYFRQTLPGGGERRSHGWKLNTESAREGWCAVE
ncbi:hypothetical protein [Leptospirillum ferriphilum]|uniref:hypothetical protein n=1 Tax=Leptospirillum ferriphilum TaxID=178606 RepID=UPI0015C3029D|nr:hypothetical protein [Leptospirillum ferriphilum]